MSARIPTITAHHQMQLVARGFAIKHKVIEHKGAPADEFVVEFQKATRRFRFSFGFNGSGSLLSVPGFPVFVVSKKNPDWDRRSEDSTAMEQVDAFLREIGFHVNRTNSSGYAFIHPIKQQVAA